jgi:hypothetical protein
MKFKTAFDGEWVKTTPMLSKRFGVDVIPQCEMCKRMSCAPHWYSIKHRVFGCQKCFTPEGAK